MLAKDAPDTDEIVGKQIRNVSRSAAYLHEAQQEWCERYQDDNRDPNVRMEGLLQIIQIIVLEL